MLYFFLGAAALFLILAGAHAFTRANPAALADGVRLAGGAGALILAAILAARGAAEFAAPAALLGLWLLAAKRGFFRRTEPGTPGGASRAVTDHLDVELDLGTGKMTGKILKGFFAGRRLEGLRAAEIVHLWQDCRHGDMKSARIVEAFLDREYPAWREDLARGEAEMGGGPGGRMTAKEARAILGLKAGAGADDIRRAYRELMMRMHPDRGGSSYLAAKINEAKDVLLDGLDGGG